MHRNIEALRDAVEAFITDSDPHERNNVLFSQLRTMVFEHQAACCAPFSRLVEKGHQWLPIDVFKHTTVHCNDVSNAVAFRTSGTTVGARGTHYFSSTALYEAAAKAHARSLWPDAPPSQWIFFLPHPREAPDSSLSFMAEKLPHWFGGDVVWVNHDGDGNWHQACAALDAAQRLNRKVCVFGTSFALAYFQDALGEKIWSLGHGSHVLFTGGFKGRHRRINAENHRASLRRTFGVQSASGEYGMTELSSQLYESPSNAIAGYRWPRWVQVDILDPATLSPQPDGTLGMVAITDLANIESCAFILTSDLGVVKNERLKLHGRADDATLRGCSLRAEELLSP